jgi:hypothetical protein
MRAIVLALLIAPPLCIGDDVELISCAAVKEVPWPDARIAAHLCDAFGRHPRLGDKLTGCRSDDAEIDLYGKDITAQDLDDFCASIEAVPSAQGNIVITARDREGIAIAISRCLVDKEFRHGPVDVRYTYPARRE